MICTQLLDFVSVTAEAKIESQQSWSRNPRVASSVHVPKTSRSFGRVYFAGAQVLSGRYCCGCSVWAVMACCPDLTDMFVLRFERRNIAYRNGTHNPQRLSLCSK